MKGIKNIIFDLGGVIIDLDFNLTFNEFNKISEIPFETIYAKTKRSELFNLFDTGKISESDFFKELRKELRYKGPEENLYDAWNIMLLGVPERRLDTLIELKQRYSTFLLSNTNETHIKAFERDLYLRNGVRNFNDYFDEVYYSCRIGMRKPDKEIFEYVSKENKLKPEQTIFIDDSDQHVKAAGNCGINAYLLQPNMEVKDLLTQLNLL